MAKIIKKRKLRSVNDPVDALNAIASNKSRSQRNLPHGTDVYDIPSSSPEREQRRRRESPRKRHQTRSHRNEPEVTEDAALDQAQSEHDEEETQEETREADQHMNDAPEREPEQNGNSERQDDEASRKQDETIRFPILDEFGSSDDEQEEREPQEEPENQTEEGNLRIFDSDEAQDQQEDSDDPDEPNEIDDSHEEQENLETEDLDDKDPENEDLVQEARAAEQLEQEESEQEEPGLQHPENGDYYREEDNEDQEGEDERNDPSHDLNQGPAPSVQVIIHQRSASTGQSVEDIDHNKVPASQNGSSIIQPAIRQGGRRRRRANVIITAPPRPQSEPEPEPEPAPNPGQRARRQRPPPPAPEYEIEPAPEPEYFGEIWGWFSQTVQHTKNGALWKELYERASRLRRRKDESMPSQFEDVLTQIFSIRDHYLDIYKRPVAEQLPPFFTTKAAELCTSSLDAIQLSLDFPSIPEDQHDPEIAGELILSLEEHILPQIVVSIVLALRTYILFGVPAKAPFLKVLQLVVDCCDYIDMLRPYYENKRNRQRSWKLGMCAKSIKRHLVVGSLLDLLAADFFEDSKSTGKSTDNSADESAEESAQSPMKVWSDEEEGAFADAWAEPETKQSSNRYMSIKTRIHTFSRFSIQDLMVKALELDLDGA